MPNHLLVTECSLNTSLVPIATICELNQVLSSQCSVQGKNCSSVPVHCYQKQGRRRGLLGGGENQVPWYSQACLPLWLCSPFPHVHWSQFSGQGPSLRVVGHMQQCLWGLKSWAWAMSNKQAPSWWESLSCSALLSSFLNALQLGS